MNRYFKKIWGVAFASLVGACSDDPVTPPDPCQAPPVISGLEVSNISCESPEGSVEVVSEGGNGTLLYSINGTDFQNGKTFSKLSVGTYTLIVKDEKDCQVSKEFSIQDENDLQLSIASRTDTGCGTSEGSVQLEAGGGVGNHMFSLDGESFQPEPAFHQLSAGAFTAFVRDEKGCTSTAEFVLITGISYEASVKDIIQTNCAISGCHVAGTGRANFEQFSQVKNKASTILSYTQSGHMPPESSGKKLSQEELDAIACWVRDGATEN